MADVVVNGASSATARSTPHDAASAARSVSATLHDRSRHGPGGPRHSHGSRAPPPPPLGAGGGPNGGTAKETFLNYFFGGPAAAGGPGQDSMPGTMASPVAPSGRELHSDSNSLDRATLLHSRTVEGSPAAFDMKSLSKHIEALPQDAEHPSMREEMETTLIRSLIASYFGIVRQTIQDLVPKAVMHFLVNYTCQHVQNRLVTAMYKPELFSQLLHEDDTIVSERNRVKALLDAYKEAFKTLSEVSIKSS